MTDTRQEILAIKADLRAMMNGMAAAAMRQAGLTQDYRLNFGVELPRLQQLATDLRARIAHDTEKSAENREKPSLRPSQLEEEPSSDSRGVDLPTQSGEARLLAQALWHEQVRECRILALLLYPPEQMAADLACEWAATIRQIELAQLAALHLFSRIPEASQCAFQWIAAPEDITQILGYYTLTHLLRRAALSERSAQELADQAHAALASSNPQLVRAARLALSAVAPD